MSQFQCFRIRLRTENARAVNIEIYGPPELFDLFLCRMLWAISDPVMRTLYALENAPQEPPPMWQVACLRDYGVKTRITADASWTNQLDSLDMYTGTQACSLPQYPQPIPGLNTALYPHQVSSPSHVDQEACHIYIYPFSFRRSNGH